MPAERIRKHERQMGPRHRREGPESMAGAAGRFCKLGSQGRPGLRRETDSSPGLAWLPTHLPPPAVVLRPLLE